MDLSINISIKFNIYSKNSTFFIIANFKRKYGKIFYNNDGKKCVIFLSQNVKDVNFYTPFDKIKVKTNYIVKNILSGKLF